MIQRIVTATVIIAVLLPILLIGGTVFQIFGLMVTIVATSEMIVMRNSVAKSPLTINFLAIITMISVVFLPETSYVLYVLIVFFLFLSVTSVISKRFGTQDVSFYLQMIIYLGFSFRALFFVREYDLMLFLFLVLVVSLSDVAAYFVGRAIGKRKLAPEISPKKTVEGSIGGWIISAIAGFGFGFWQGLFDNYAILIGVSLMLPIIAQIGDLQASLLKREHGIKDFGKIFPGHGGVLDRVDSHMLSALVLYLVLNLRDIV